MKKKLLILGLVLLVFVSLLAACGDNVTPTNKPESRPAQAATPTGATSPATQAQTSEATSTTPAQPVTRFPEAVPTFPPDNTPANPATAATNPASASLPPAVTPPATMASNLGRTPSSSPVVTTAGTVTALDLQSGTLTLNTTNGKLNQVKLNARTSIMRKSSPVQASEIRVGDKLTASGVLDGQGQVEAALIALDIISPSRPIGDPGFPNEKG